MAEDSEEKGPDRLNALKKDDQELELSPTQPDSNDLVFTASVDTDYDLPSTFRIGHYRVLRELGKGGMGTIYLGVRADREFTKHVAIKLIRKGMDSSEIVARFRRERQILASLDHPNIAKLLDGGSTEEGLPYFVMEHIQGRPLTDYCNSHNLSTKERLQLFRTICSAVQFAHQNLVVHRDLKPANILVTAEGVPKLLDFGIAKLLNPDFLGEDAPPTATDVRVLTPDYASPEQVRGDPVTTVSDIYSLGVILYELLAGRRPYRITTRNHMELYRVVCEQEPEKPSTAVTKKKHESGQTSSQLSGVTPDRLRKELSGDLDNIILLALRKEPQKRYASAEALSEDIRRYLEGHPVQARKGTWTYRAGKYVSRHKAGVTAAVIVALLLIAFAITTQIQNVRIAQQRDIAEKQKAKAETEAQKSEKVTQFLTDLFEVNNPAQAKGQTITAREILDKGAEKIRSEMKDQPEVQSKMMNTLGTIYESMGLYDQASNLFNDALKIRKELHGPEHAAVAESLHSLAELLYDQGKYDEAEKVFRETLAMRKKLYGKEHVDVASTLSNLGSLLSTEGKSEEAETVLREALVMRRKLLGNEHKDVAISLSDLAGLLQDKGQSDDSERLYRESIAIERRLLGDQHPDVAINLNNLANVLLTKGDVGAAEKLYRESVAIQRKLWGEHPYLATSLYNLATLLQSEEKTAEAEKLYREALEMKLKLLGREHPEVAVSMLGLASLLRNTGKLEESEKLYREAMDVEHKVGLTDEHPYVIAAIVGLADVFVAKGDIHKAFPLLEQVLSMPVDKLPQDNRYRLSAMSSMGAIRTAQKRYPEAESLLLDAYKALAVLEPGLIRTKMAFQRIVDLYLAWGKPDKADAFRKTAAVAGY